MSKEMKEGNFFAKALRKEIDYTNDAEVAAAIIGAQALMFGFVTGNFFDSPMLGLCGGFMSIIAYFPKQTRVFVSNLAIAGWAMFSFFLADLIRLSGEGVFVTGIVFAFLGWGGNKAVLSWLSRLHETVSN